MSNQKEKRQKKKRWKERKWHVFAHATTKHHLACLANSQEQKDKK
jgi:hypothetical protein